jgi:hypothetical protein
MAINLGRPTRLFLSSGSGRAGCYCFCYCNVSKWTGDAAIKKFIRGGFGYGSFSQGTTFVNKRRNPVGGWLNVDDFAGLRVLVLNEVIARNTWLGGDGSGKATRSRNGSNAPLNMSADAPFNVPLFNALDWPSMMVGL